MEILLYICHLVTFDRLVAAAEMFSTGALLLLRQLVTAARLRGGAGGGSAGSTLYCGPELCECDLTAAGLEISLD